MFDRKIVFPDKPDWGPLKKAVGDKHKEFMFMGMVAIGEIWVFLYKHINTRRCLNLDGVGGAYHYKDGKYWPIEFARAVKRVFI